MVSEEYPNVSLDHMMAIHGARRKLIALITEKNCASLMYGLGVCYLEERFGLSLGLDFDKVNLNMAMDLLVPIKQKFPILSHADLYELARVIAVSVSRGPKLRFHPGRKDGPPIAPLTDAIKATEGFDDHDKNKDYFTNQDIIALSGARCLERKWQTNWNSGFDEPMVVKFDNSYFKDLLSNDNCGVLIDRDTRLLVEKYAADENAFFEDYKDANQKLSDLWFPNKSAPNEPAHLGLMKRVRENCFKSI